MSRMCTCLCDVLLFNITSGQYGVPVFFFFFLWNTPHYLLVRTVWMKRFHWSIAPISIHIHRLVHCASFSLLGKRPLMCGWAYLIWLEASCGYHWGIARISTPGKLPILGTRRSTRCPQQPLRQISMDHVDRHKSSPTTDLQKTLRKKKKNKV